MFQYYFRISLTDLQKLNTFLFMKFYHDIVQSFCNYSRIGDFQIGRLPVLASHPFDTRQKGEMGQMQRETGLSCPGVSDRKIARLYLHKYRQNKG